jgi:hypothetical protein
LSEIRVEILIPINYNDGTLVEDEKLIQTYDDIVERFSACSMNNSETTGRWMDPKTKTYYNDKLRSIWVLCEDSKDNRDYFNRLRTELCERFKQKEILMYYNPISTEF